MLPRLQPRRPTLTLAIRSSKKFFSGHQSFLTPWRKHAYLQRLPQPNPLEKIRLEPGNIVHPSGPVASEVRGEEHIHPLDLDYKHVTPEDERIGLVLTSIHPNTQLDTITSYLKRQSIKLRHGWVHAEGVCCLRFQDEGAKERAQKHFEELETYPFHGYDIKNRHWRGKVPEEQPPVQVKPLTAEYTQETPEPGKVLVLRTVLGLSQTILAPFRQYGRPDACVDYAYSKFYAHDHWVWEYYLRFPTIEDAKLALKNHAGEKITVPYSSLTTVEKLRFPYGKTQHLWLQHTGLDALPRNYVKVTKLYKTIYSQNTRGLPRNLRSLEE